MVLQGKFSACVLEILPLGTELALTINAATLESSDVVMAFRVNFFFLNFCQILVLGNKRKKKFFQ